MKRILPLLLLANMASAQWIRKGQVITELGALPPISVNLKTGYAFKNNTVAGIFAEHQDLFTKRSEIGIFGRKYMLDKRRVNFYLHGAASVGRYKTWHWGFHHHSREEMRNHSPFNALKFIGGGGINFRIMERVSIGHEATLGISNYKGRSFASSHITLNYCFGPKE